MADFFEKLGNMDRRIIFVLIALSVIIPVSVNIIFPNPVGAEPSRDLFNYIIDSLPAGSNVLLSFDYDPSTMPELQPMAVALTRQFFDRDINIVAMALWPQGASLGQEVLSEQSVEVGKEQYVDWVNLGYKTGGGVLIVRLGTGIESVFPEDKDGMSWDSIPMLSEIKDLSDFDLVVSLSAGDPGIPAWVMMAGDRYNVPIGGGCTAVSAPQFFPYLRSGQMVGLLGGLKGAADYESLTDSQGKGIEGMAPQSIAHLVIMLLIVAGNISYFVTRKKSRGGAA